MKLAKSLLLVWLLVSPAVDAADIEFFRPAEYVEQNLPFSRAVRVGDLLFLAGDLGAKQGKLVEGGMQAEARQTMENIKSTLQHFGLTTDNLVKCTVFLAAIEEWGQFNEVYASYFKNSLPARAAFAANGLALNARVEVDCIAAFPD